MPFIGTTVHKSCSNKTKHTRQYAPCRATDARNLAFSCAAYEYIGVYYESVIFSLFSYAGGQRDRQRTKL